jgi:phosphoserine phosphatase RsbU/P
MNKQIKNFTQSRGLENTILVAILLFLFNIIFPLHDTIVLSIINEALVFLTVFFLYNYIQRFLHSKVDAPLTLVLNAGILAALIFFIVSIINAIYGADKNNTGFFNSLFSILIVFVFIAAIVYIFSTFRELFFLRQKKDPITYFNTMLIFFTLCFFSHILLLFDSMLDYAHDAFYVVTIVLISLNSLRVSWIAFLPKRQKYYLLIISIVLSILFGFNFFMISNGNIMMRNMLSTFSPGVHTFISLVMIYGSIYFAVIFFTTLFHLPTAEAFDRKADEVSSLMDLTKLITQVFDFKELSSTITTLTTRVCNSQSAWLVTKTDSNYELSSVYNIGFVDADQITNYLFGSNENEYESIEVIHNDDVNFNNKTDMQPFKSLAIAPLKVHGKINGYLFVARQRENNFDLDERKSVQAFADYAAVALENAKLIEESIEKERLEKELDVARDIQRKILPRSAPVTDKFQISALFVPAFEVGGDYYDFFELDDDRFGFVVADVSGKGIGAAFIMAEVKGVFESLSKIIFDPRELLITVNNILKTSLDRKSFVTAIYGVINKKTGKLKFARAGHTPVLHCSNGKIDRLQPAGLGMGLDYTPGFASSIKEMEIQLKNNDIVVCYSDGIPEAKNDHEEDFGYDRLDSIILANKEKDLDLISNAVMKDLSLFSRNHSQHDDITLVIFKWNQNN